MSTTPVPPFPSVPPGLSEGWAANYKLLFDQVMQRLSEHDQLFDDARAHRDALFEKLVTDAQSAANLALLNAVNNADALAKSSLRHSEIAAADQWGEQADIDYVTTDDLNKLNQTITAQIQAGFAAVTATLANMATGRPPVNQSGTTAVPVAGPAGT